MMMMKERKARACQILGRFNLHIMMAKTKEEEEFFFRADETYFLVCLFFFQKKSPELDSFFSVVIYPLDPRPKFQKIFFDLMRNNFFFVLFY